ncbi:hypothetical protein EGW08_016944, partial [Elysia chlorotica]
MWQLIEEVLQPTLHELRLSRNNTDANDQSKDLLATGGVLGFLIITPVRIRQVRVLPYEGQATDHACLPVPRLQFDVKRVCNFELTSDIEERRNFSTSWDVVLKDGQTGLDLFRHWKED